jgi:hypothetical protein
MTETRKKLYEEVRAAFERNKLQILTNAYEKFRDAINVTDEQIYQNFRDEVVKRTGTYFGGKNIYNSLTTVEEAVAAVLRTALFQTKERMLAYNSLSSFGSSQAFHKLVQYDPTVTIEDMIENATYKKEATGNGGRFGLDDDLPTLERGFLYTSPGGKRYFIMPPDSPTGRGWTWFLV